jgi:AcrR family transcriptional regulator
VIEAGMRILREEGIDAVTMRRVAGALDTGAASLYVYVGGRDELLRLLFDEVAAGVEIEPVDPARWREQLRTLSVRVLEALEAHPGIARVALAEVPSGEAALARAETMMSLLLAAGVEPQRASWALDAIFLLITATAVETLVEHEKVEAGGSGRDGAELQQAFAALPAERFPNLAAHAGALTSGDQRDRFLFAIDTFVDGLVR